MEKHNIKKVVLLIGTILLLALAIIFHDVTKAKGWVFICELVLALVILGLLLSKLGDKSNSAKVVLVTIMVFFVLTWIFPAAYFSSEYVEQGRVQMGLFDLFNYPITALSYFGYIAFYIILVGGFYGILYKIPAYRSFLDKIVDMTKGMEKIVLVFFVVLNAFLVSICGVHLALALFIPLIVSIILLMGYDKMVAAMVIVGSIIAGLIGTTFAYNNVSVVTSTFGIAYDYQIGVRFVILLVAIALVIFNILMYIKNHGSKVKIEKKTIKKVEEKVVEKVVEEKTEVKKPKTSSKNTNRSSNTHKSSGKKTTKSSKSRKSDRKAALKDEDIIVVKENMMEDSCYVPDNTTKKHSIWPFMLTFFLLFVLFVLAFISWGENGFNNTFFDKITTNVKGFTLFGFPLFAKLLGTFNSFGSWTITDLLLPMSLMVLLLVVIYKVPFEDVRLGFKQGAKRALGPAVIVILTYTVLVLVVYHPFQLVIYKAVLDLAKGFNVATTVVVAILCGFFNSDLSYSMQSVIPYYASLDFSSEIYGTAAIIFQAMYGLSALVAPTSLVLLATLSYLKISYKDWMKNIWKLLLELFIVLLIVFIILAVI